MDTLSTRHHPVEDFESWIREPGNWSGNHLNIYFVGNMIVDGSSPGAFNKDPRDAGDGKGYIVISDGGQQLASGFVPGPRNFYPGGLTPSAMASYHILTHEVAHHFLDRRDCPPYNDGILRDEHVPMHFEHLLARGFTPPPCVLELRSGEIEEIQCRHTSGSWTWATDNCTQCP